MKILSIETSCDETAISILEADFNDSDTKDIPKFKILGDALHSQIDIHTDFGGVFPTLAKREHAKNFTPILIAALKQAQLLFEQESDNFHGVNLHDAGAYNENSLTIPLSFLSEKEESLQKDLIEFFVKYKKPEIDAIAVTVGPGLEPALWVGINGAKALAHIWNLPIIPVNHMEGHIASILIDEAEKEENDQDKKLEFPAVALLISGGHTELVAVNSWGDYKLLGQTRDDAVGEAFDKVARIIGLKYPGGPKISALAKKFRDGEFKDEQNSNGTPNKISVAWNFPRPMITKKDCDFSFSGLKTSVLYAVRDLGRELTEVEKTSLCYEFEESVTEVLISKTMRAMEESNAQTLIIGGGVSANAHIRESFKKVASEQGLTLLIPQYKLSTDNSIMIGVAGFLQYSSGNYIENLNEDDLAHDQENHPKLRANGNLRL